MYSNNRISNLISSQLPFFVRNDHPNFILFLEAYYQYLEQSNNVVNVAKNVVTYRDVDLTEDQYAQKLYDTFMKYIPENVIVDKSILIKNIKDFYRAKGTEKATRFLMRILYNEEIEFYYPKKDILRASDGKWFIQKSLRVTDTAIANVSNTLITGLEKYVGTKITGATSNATALIERVEQYFEQGTQIDELILSNINRSFSSGEKIYALFNDGNGTIFISSNVFSGIINTIQVTNGGSGYSVGDPVIILSSTGSGACATVSSITTGNISAITVLAGGTGYRVSDNVSITGGGGTGATANIALMDLSEKYHPNSYNIVSSTINLEANTPLNNTTYSNLSSSNINSSISNAVSYWTYANTGAIQTIFLLTPGSNYSVKPDITIVANTVIYSLGVLGRMEIVNGGQNYSIGDKIEFINVPGGYGVGALGNVTNVDTSQSNAINEVEFIEMTGHIIGGSGYNEFYLPKANVISSTGNGANIIVTNILGTGANLTSLTSSIGSIQRIDISSRGSGYRQNTTIDLSQSGDGTAQATVSVVEGTYSYPGRYLNDDGHISSYNFLEDRDYYQNFSYSIKSSKSVASYRDILKNTIHPSGLKLWGEYHYLNQTANTTCPCDVSDAIIKTSIVQTYTKTGNTINISYSSHGLSENSNITLEFTSGGYDNVRNGIYTISNVQTDFFTVIQKSNIANITINNAGLLYNSNSYLIFTGNGIGANASFTKNANGSIVSVTLNEPGIMFTEVPIVTANGSNSIPATFNVTISYQGNTTGNVIVGKYI